MSTVLWSEPHRVQTQAYIISLRPESDHQYPHAGSPSGVTREVGSRDDHHQTTVGPSQDQRESHTLTEPILDHLEAYFRELHQSLGEGETPVEAFSLDEHGPIMFLTDGDRPEDPQRVGMSNGRRGTAAEFCELLRLDENELYFAGTLKDNESMVVLFADPGKLSREVGEWFRKQIGSEEQ